MLKTALATPTEFCSTLTASLAAEGMLPSEAGKVGTQPVSTPMPTPAPSVAVPVDIKELLSAFEKRF